MREEKMAKRKMLIASLITILFSLGLISMSFADTPTAADTPTEAIRTTVDSVLDTLKDEELAKPANNEKRREQIRSLIRERFNFIEMSRRSLARHWKGRSDAEKREFVDVFSDLLVASYIGKIESYTDEKVRYDKETIKKEGKYGVVSTSIVTENVDIPIDYKLINKKGKWWVYDVVVEGVSFISTYRSQYNEIIVKKSYAELISSMKKKLDEVNEVDETPEAKKS
jgi:phospholipid transport system substrate-binding protein